jgi:hypothetical protein
MDIYLYYTIAMTNEQLQIRRDRARKWASDHPDRAKRTRQLYYQKNKIRLRKQAADKHSKHPEIARDSSRAWRERYPWYDSWQAAKQRCNNPNCPRFKDYGGRGIKFRLSKMDIQFLWTRDRAESMKDPTIDRRDNDGDYSLDNCRILERWENSKIGALRRSMPGIFIS